MAEDDCVEQLHVSGLEYLSQLLGDCCFSWLDCDKCLINNTKVFDERYLLFTFMLVKFV